MSDYRLCIYRGVYAVTWSDGGGRHRVTLGTKSRAEADRLLSNYVAGAKRGADARDLSVAEAWESYRETMKGRYAYDTMGHIWKSVGPVFGNRGAESLTEEDCRSYIESRRKLGKKDSTIWTELSRLRSALKWAENKKLIDRAPKIWVPPQGEPRDLRMTRAQVSSYIEACSHPHIRLFSILAVTTGARMGAILGLTWDRVDFDRGMIVYRDPKLALTKKGRAETPINPMALEALKEARARALTPFVIEWAGQRVATVKKGLAAAGKRAGLPWVTAHVFRHTAGSLMAEGGVPMSEIAQFLGHKDTKTTERVYARFSPSYLRKAASVLDFS